MGKKCPAARGQVLYVGKACVVRQTTLGYPGRCFEHLRAALRPNAGEGTKPRYRLLRRSLGSTFMLPALVAATEARAFALERTAIQLEAPQGNALDERARARELLAGVATDSDEVDAEVARRLSLIRTVLQALVAGFRPRDLRRSERNCALHAADCPPAGAPGGDVLTPPWGGARDASGAGK